MVFDVKICCLLVRKSRARGSSRDRSHSACLFVGNLPYSFRERDVIEYFERCSPIRNITVGFNRRTGQSKGYAFVEFEHRHDAEDAFDRYNGYDFDGRRLRIDWDVGLDKKVQGRRKTSTRFVCFVLFVLQIKLFKE